jgi:carbon-monoxide dehydrogenase large subunit
MEAQMIGRLVGQSVRRSEDTRILTGSGRYVDDVQLPGTLHAAFVRSTEAHARIVRLDVDDARGAPGVVAVYTGEDLEELTVTTPATERRGTKVPESRVLTTDKVRLVGDPVAMVVAESRYLAEDACELVLVEYEPLEPVVTPGQALDPARPPIHEYVGTNASAPTTRSWGEVDDVFAEADRVVQATFAQSRHANVPMETRGAVASYDPETGELTVTASTQGAHGVKGALAAGLKDLPAERIRVLADEVGGAFGQKFGAPAEFVAISAASRQLGRPVKWIEDRAENLSVGGQAREETLAVQAAVKDDGTVLGLKVDMTVVNGAYGGMGGGLAGIVSRLICGPYRMRALQFGSQAVYSNKGPYVAYRGPWEAETWVRERTLDVVARELGMDPADIRRKNMVRADEDARLVTGASLAGVTSLESLERALRRVDYESLRRQQAQAREQGRLMGIGFATFIEAAPGPIEQNPDRPPPPPGSGERARTWLEDDGSVTLATAQAPHGQGHQTTLAQIAAEELGLPFERVRVIHGDTSNTPYGFGTGGSRAGTHANGAARVSSRSLKQKLIDAASHMLEIAPEDLEVSGGFVTPSGSPTKALSFADIAANADERIEAEEAFMPTRGGWSGGTHLCVVEIDPDTGLVNILRYVVVEDCGKMVNPAIVEGQIRGGVAQGIGGVLLEHSAYDEQSGQYLASTFMDYLLPTATDVPEIEIEHIESEPLDEFDFRGIGEGGAIVAPAALTNAIEDALAHLGVRVYEQHLPPSRILELIGAVPAR